MCTYISTNKQKHQTNKKNLLGATTSDARIILKLTIEGSWAVPTSGIGIELYLAAKRSRELCFYGAGACGPFHLQDTLKANSCAVVN